MNNKAIILSFILAINIVGNVFAASESFECDPRNPLEQFSQYQKTETVEQSCPLQDLNTLTLKEIFSHFVDKDAFNAIEHCQDPREISDNITKFVDSIKTLIKSSQTCKQWHGVLTQENIISMLKANGIDINKVFTNKLSFYSVDYIYENCQILHMAIRCSCDLSVIKTLVYVGADINMPATISTSCREEIILNNNSKIVYPAEIAYNTRTWLRQDRNMFNIFEFLRNKHAVVSRNIQKEIACTEMIDNLFVQFRERTDTNSASFQTNSESYGYSINSYSDTESDSDTESEQSEITDSHSDAETYTSDIDLFESSSEADGDESGDDLDPDIQTIKDKKHRCTIV